MTVQRALISQERKQNIEWVASTTKSVIHVTHTLDQVSRSAPIAIVMNVLHVIGLLMIQLANITKSAQTCSAIIVK